MKTFIYDLKLGFFVGLVFISVVVIGGFIYASSWGTASPTTITNDPALFSDNGNILTSAKWNELVNKANNSSKGMNNAKILICTYSQSNAGAVGWKIQTWSAIDCGGINKPSDFINIIPSISRIDGTGIQRGLANCTNTTGMIYLDTANSQAIIKCSYLVWN